MPSYTSPSGSREPTARAKGHLHECYNIIYDLASKEHICNIELLTSSQLALTRDSLLLMCNGIISGYRGYTNAKVIF